MNFFKIKHEELVTSNNFKTSPHLPRTAFLSEEEMFRGFSHRDISGYFSARDEVVLSEDCKVEYRP